jgi:hypothetical protein
LPDVLGGDGADHNRMHNVLLVARIAFWFVAHVLTDEELDQPWAVN